MVEQVASEPYTFDFSGGVLCLDFANTVSDRPEPRPVEHLNRYADLVSWGRQVGVLADDRARRLLDAAVRHPDQAEAVLARAVALREAIYRIFLAVANDLAPAKGDLAALNDALADALSRARVVPGGGGFAWGWADDMAALDSMLWPVARSAADLLTSGDLGVVRVCPGSDCRWLFADRSRNGSRRWCDMKVCGNRAKARRFQQRKRATASG
jgi:predicted RNA-binding Zn ribbon-like protein